MPGLCWKRKPRIQSLLLSTCVVRVKVKFSFVSIILSSGGVTFLCCMGDLQGDAGWCGKEQSVHATQERRLKLKQESPPAWTQEAYRLSHIKYSISCPIPGGTLSLDGRISPLSPSLVSVPWYPQPGLGYPLARYLPSQGQGAPSQDWGTPQKGTWDLSLGYPRKDMGPWWLWYQWKYYGMEMGYPPGMNWQTNWNYDLRHPQNTRIEYSPLEQFSVLFWGSKTKWVGRYQWRYWHRKSQ